MKQPSPTEAVMKVLAPTPLGIPGLLIPIFESENAWWIQDTNRGGRVARFNEIEIDNQDSIISSPAEIRVRLGQSPVYALALDTATILVGRRSALSRLINFADPRLANEPELRLDLAEFVGNLEAQRAAQRQIDELEAIPSRTTVTKQRDRKNSLPYEHALTFFDTLNVAKPEVLGAINLAIRQHFGIPQEQSLESKVLPKSKHSKYAKLSVKYLTPEGEEVRQVKVISIKNKYWVRPIPKETSMIPKRMHGRSKFFSSVRSGFFRRLKAKIRVPKKTEKAEVEA
jgi:hypothetical protein